MDQSSILGDGSTSAVSAPDEHPSRIRLSLAATLVSYWTRHHFRLCEADSLWVLSRAVAHLEHLPPSFPGGPLRPKLWSETVAAINELSDTRDKTLGVGHASVELADHGTPKKDAAEAALLARSALENLDGRLPHRWLVIANRAWIENVAPATIAESFCIPRQDVDQQLQNVADALSESLLAFEEFFEHPTEIVESIRRSASSASELVACRYLAVDWMRSHADSTLHSESLNGTIEDGAIGPLDGELAPSPLLFVREHLQKGGLSDIWLADDDRGRAVVVKTLRKGVKQNRSMRLRFQREITICTRLTHPGIVSVLHHGFDTAGNAYFSMPLIKGKDLREIIRMNSLSRRELVRHIIDAANAVSYAHSNGVVHRDLKPHNIMVGDFGETVVIDWGLAKTLEESDIEDSDLPLPDSERLDGTRGQAGTPSYMSPEQARGSSGREDEVGIRTDVYGLGATLYTALVGQSPFAHLERDQALKHVLKGNFPPPRHLDASIPRPLQAIVLKAMRLDPKERYPNAAAFAAELQAWLDDQTVRAHRQNLLEITARWIRHNPAISGALMPGLLCIVLGLAWNSSQIRARNRQILIEKGELERSVDAAEQAIESLQEENRLLARQKSEFAFEVSDELYQTSPSEQHSLTRLGHLSLYALTTHKSSLLGRLKFTARQLFDKLFDELDAHEKLYGVSVKSRIIRIVALGDRGLMEASTDAQQAIRSYQLALDLAEEIKSEASEEELRELENERCTQLGNIGDACMIVRLHETPGVDDQKPWLKQEIVFRTQCVDACMVVYDRAPKAFPTLLKSVLAVQAVRLGSVLIETDRKVEAIRMLKNVLERDKGIETHERYNSVQQICVAACFAALADDATATDAKQRYRTRALEALVQASKAHADYPVVRLGDHLDRPIFKTLRGTEQFQRIRREYDLMEKSRLRTN